MLDFKVLNHAAVTIAGVELLHRIRKGQFDLARLRVRGQAAPTIWNAVLSARPARRFGKLLGHAKKFAPEPHLGCSYFSRKLGRFGAKTPCAATTCELGSCRDRRSP